MDYPRLNKKTLRSHFQLIRNNLSEKRKKEAALNLFSFFIKNLSSYQNTLSFISIRNEINLSKINDFLLQKGLCLPELKTKNFYKILNKKSLIFNKKYNIFEPDITKCEKIDPLDIHLILVPGLCFDINKTRLGYGMGFYDKILTKTKAITYGIGFKEQLFSNLIPKEKHDISLNKLILF